MDSEIIEMHSDTDVLLHCVVTGERYRDEYDGDSSGHSADHHAAAESQ